MYDDDDEEEPFLLVLGVLAAVIAIVLLVFLRGESALEKYGTEEVVSEPAAEPAEEAAAPEPAAVPSLAWAALPAFGAAGIDSAPLSFSSNVASSYEFTAVGADGSAVSDSGSGTDYSVDVNGLTPATDYSWELTITDEAGESLTETGTFTTGAPELDATDVTVSLGEASVTLEGTVPDEDTSGSVEAAAVAQYGDVVVNNLVIDDTYTNEGGTIRVIGEVGTQASVDAANGAFGGLLAGLSIDNQLTVSSDALVSDLNELFQLEPIQFDSGSANIRDESTATLDDAAALLLANTEASVTVEGHTDSQGDDGLNLGLSQDRAQAVLDYLAGAGVDESRLSATGFGEGNPIADNGTPEGRQQNRRIEFKLNS